MLFRTEIPQSATGREQARGV